MSTQPIIIDDTPAPAPKATSEVLRLQFPITAQFRTSGMAAREETIETLTIRRVKMGDIIEVNKFKDEMKQAAVMFSRLTGYSEEIFKELDVEDVEEFNKVVENFTPASLKTGKT